VRLEAERAEMRQRKRQAPRRIAQLKAQIASLSSQVTLLNVRVATLTRQVNALTAQNGAFGVLVTQLNGKIAAQSQGGLAAVLAGNPKVWHRPPLDFWR
jgi:hypothetical protein